MIKIPPTKRILPGVVYFVSKNYVYFQVSEFKTLFLNNKDNRIILT